MSGAILFNASPAKAGAQLRRLELAWIVLANEMQWNWAPAFAGEAFGIGRGYH